MLSEEGSVAVAAGLSVHIALQRPPSGPGFSLAVKLDFAHGLSVLFGPSGSGKTTMLSAIAGLLRPDSGRVTLGNRVLFDAQERVDVPTSERQVALVFQSLALFPHLDALGNVQYGLPRRFTKAQRRELAESWLSRMRAPHLARRYPSSFSGGEAQRVALARALASEPRALLLDEPFSALDRGLASELSAELVEHVRSLSIPVVLVTHDRSHALELGCSVTLLRAGHVERVGPARELL